MQATVIQSIRVGQVIDAIAMASYWRDEPKYRSAIAARVIDGVRVVDSGLTNGGEVYDWSQSDEALRDGDVFLFANGTAAGILVECWPTLVAGQGAALHRLDGHTWETFESGKYAAAAAVARKLTSH